MSTCCVVKCKNSTFWCKTNQVKAEFFRFPNDEELRSIWIRACGQDTSVPIKLHYRVCSSHFNASDYKITRARCGLLDTAVPKTSFGKDFKSKLTDMTVNILSQRREIERLQLCRTQYVPISGSIAMWLVSPTIPFPSTFLLRRCRESTCEACLQNPSSQKVSISTL